MTAKPRGHCSTPVACQQAREHLGLSKAALARLMRLGDSGRDTVRAYEQGERPISGPYQLALEALVSGWRPMGSKLPKADFGPGRMA